jgi:hypothetical protein
MVFKNHKNLEGQHAILSASRYAWVNYDEEKMIQTYYSLQQAKRGTELHEYAAMAIRLGQKCPKSNKTICRYINDGISYRMTPEQVLYYSENAYGTADTISFREDLLRIHDLKTGVTPAKMTQLEIYAAFFCLEYHIKPKDIDMELRIYQNDEVVIHIPQADDIVERMDKIIEFDRLIQRLKTEE